MRADTIRFDQIRYNPATEAYEAHVSVYDNDNAYDYAVSVCAPMTAEYGLIARRLTEAARAAHNRARGAMRLRRAVEMCQQPVAA